MLNCQSLALCLGCRFHVTSTGALEKLKSEHEPARRSEMLSRKHAANHTKLLEISTNNLNYHWYGKTYNVKDGAARREEKQLHTSASACYRSVMHNQ